MAERREAAEQAFAAQSRAREELQGQAFAARSAAERIALRLERAREQARAAEERRGRRLRQIELLDGHTGSGEDERAAAERIAELERELEGLDRDREERARGELAKLEEERAEAERRGAELTEAVERCRAALDEAELQAEQARGARRDAERAVQAARERAARAGAELAAVNQLLRSAGPATGGARPLADGLRVEPGYELALAAALGPRLSAAVVTDLAAGESLLDEAGERGGTTLVSDGRVAARAGGASPGPGAERLLSRVKPDRPLAALAERLLAGVWVVDSLAGVPRDFCGVAVTRSGRVFDGRSGELAQAPAGGAERLLEEAARRDTLVAASEEAVRRGGPRPGGGEQRRRGGGRIRQRAGRGRGGAAARIARRRRGRRGAVARRVAHRAPQRSAERRGPTRCAAPS